MHGAGISLPDLFSKSLTLIVVIWYHINYMNNPYSKRFSNEQSLIILTNVSLPCINFNIDGCVYQNDAEAGCSNLFFEKNKKKKKNPDKCLAEA